MSWTTGGTATSITWYNGDGWPGIVYSDCTGDDPYFVSPSFSLSSASWHKVKVDIDTHGGSTHQLKVYWKRSGDSGFDESRSKYVNYSSSTGQNFVTVEVDVGSHSLWSGTINQIRIDPSSSNCAGARFHIDYIRIQGNPVGSISGGVRDNDTDAPIYNALVRLEQTNIIKYSTYSLSNGTYEIPNVTPGTYRLVGLKSGYNNWFEDGKNIVAGQNLSGQNIAMVPLAPNLSSFYINNNASSTTNKTVTLNNSATNNPTHYMASESSSFSGASWISYSSAPNFTLSSGFGTKTVYLKVKNGGGESNSRNDSINYIPTPQISDNKSSMNVGDTIELYCDLGSEGSYRNVTFFVDLGSGSLKTYGRSTNSSGLATKQLTAENDWVGETYFACRDDGTSTVSGYDASVTVNAALLNPPNLLKPLAGGTLSPLPNGEVGLRWEAVNGAAGYRLYIDTLPSMDMQADQTVYNAAGLGIGQHKWKACTLNASFQCGALSGEETFDIQTAAYGFVARTVNNPDVYWIMYGKKWKITGTDDAPPYDDTKAYDHFLKLGYTDAEVQWFESGSLDPLPPGNNILSNDQRFCYRSQDNETVYVIENGESHPFFQWDNFLGQGFTAEDIYWANPEGTSWIQSIYPEVDAPMIRVEPSELDFNS